MGASGSLSWECPWGFVVLKAFVLWATGGVLCTVSDHGLCARHHAGAEFSGTRDCGPTRGCPGALRRQGDIKENGILSPGSGCDPEVSVGQNPGRLPRGGGAGVTELGGPLGGWNKQSEVSGRKGPGTVSEVGKGQACGGDTQAPRRQGWLRASNAGTRYNP